MSRPPKFHSPIDGDFDSVLTAIADKSAPLSRTITARPFLKWVGGKRSVLPELIKRVPKEYDAYHEPFLGGGALYFALQPEKAYLSDINFHLIVTFKVVRDDTDRLIAALKVHDGRHSKEYYQNARKRLFIEKDPTKIAALFIYLNKTCYNGLYRVNKSGMFNVPMGDYKDPAIVDEENLRNCAKVLKGTDIQQHGFEQEKIYKGDFYYLDPPYHKSYSGYNGDGFADVAHQKLSEFCHEIDKRGGFFMLSNSDTPFVRTLYKGYNVDIVAASRFVSCKGTQRGKENELIIRNYQ